MQTQIPRRTDRPGPDAALRVAAKPRPAPAPRIAAVLLAATAALAGCSDPPNHWGEPEPPPDGAVWAGWPDCRPGEETQTLSFVHVNDLHASFTPDEDGESPYARIRGYYEWVRLVSPYAVFTDGGDDHEKGSLAEILSEGYAVIDLTDAMAFDVRVLGNHDFAWGLEELLDFSRAGSPSGSPAGSPAGAGLVLAANVEYTGQPREAFGAQDFGILQIGCLQVGFFGLVSKPWNEQDEQFDGDYLPELPTRHDVVDRAAEIVAQLRNQVDLVVMVSHLGLEADIDLAEQVDGIDVVLGGHTHNALESPEHAGGALVIQAGAYARYVARLDVDVDLATGAIRGHRYRLLRNTPGSLPISEPVQRTVEQILDRDAPDARLAVGTVRRSRGKGDIARLAARAAVAVLGVDAAVVDADTVWATWSPGELTPQDLLDTFKIERQKPGTPGFNSFYLTTLTGADLRRVADHLPGGFEMALSDLLRLTALDPSGLYAVALQKRVALRTDRYLPDGVEISRPVAALEAWDVLTRYALERTERCLSLDTDEPLLDCAPIRAPGMGMETLRRGSCSSDTIRSHLPTCARRPM